MMFRDRIDPHKFETLIEITNMINSDFGDLNLLLEKIVSSAMRLTTGEAASLLIVDHEKQKLFFEIALGAKGQEVKKFSLPIGEGIAGWVAMNQKSLIVGDVEGDERFFDQISKSIGFPTRSILATPMISKNTCIGVLEIINKADGYYFDDEDRLWLEIFSTQAAIAYQNARQLKKVNEELDHLKTEDSSFHTLVFKSPSMQQVMNLVERYSTTDSTVLITGESGVGKELIAEQIHLKSSFSKGPFIRINCAAIPENLMEAELFGALKGSYTDAHKDRIGKLQAAQGGTLFLDEIGTLPMNLQAKILRVLQNKEFSPIGSNELIPLQARLITATNIDFNQAIAQGTFRKDLFFRLNVLPIKVPPLRERPSDISLLSEYFLNRNNKKLDKNLAFSSESMDLLLSHPWPGNVRELENTLERASILCDDELLKPQHFHMEENWNNNLFAGPMDLKHAVNFFKSRHITKALEKNDWNQTKTSQALGIQRTYLSRLIKELNIEQKQGVNNE